MSNIMWNLQRKQAKESKNRPRKIQSSFSNLIPPSNTKNPLTTRPSNTWPPLKAVDLTNNSRSLFGKAPSIPISVFDDQTKRQFSINNPLIDESERSQSVNNDTKPLQHSNTPNVKKLLEHSTMNKENYNTVTISNVDLAVMVELPKLATKMIRLLATKLRLDIEESEITRAISKKRFLMETKHLPINTCTIVIRLAKPTFTYVNCTYFKTNSKERGVDGIRGASQQVLSHGVTFCMLPEEFFNLENFTELIVIRKFPTQLCHKVRRDINDKLSQIGDIPKFSIIISHDNGYEINGYMEISREPTLVFLIPEETPAPQIQLFYYDLHEKYLELPIDEESEEIHSSDNLTIIPVEISTRCSNFNNNKFQTVDPFYAMIIDGLKISTTNMDLLQLVPNQIPIDSIKWIIPTSFMLSTQMEYIIGTTLRIESFDSSSFAHLRAPKVQELRVMGYDYLIKSFANCGRTAVALHEDESKKFLSAKPYQISNKRQDTNAITTLTKNIVDLQQKIETMMHQITSLTNLMEQLVISQPVDYVPSNTTSPARKLPAFERVNAMVLTNPAED